MILIALLILIAAFYMTHYVGGIIWDILSNLVIWPLILGGIVFLIIRIVKRRRRGY